MITKIVKIIVSQFFLLLCVFGSQIAFAQDEVLSIETHQVVLNVTITDSKKIYITDLKLKDFKIFEDKIEQEISGVGFEETPFAATIILDASGSMENKISLARAACLNFVEGIREDDVFAIFGFTKDKVKKLLDFTSIKDIPDNVWDLQANGNTPLYDSLLEAIDGLSKRSEKRRAILVVSDGADTSSKSNIDNVIRKAVEFSVMIYAVDMSDATLFKTGRKDTGVEALRKLSNQTGGKFIPVAGGQELRDAFAQTAVELSKQYTLFYDSSNGTPDGKWRAIEVRVTRPSLNIRTKQGYYGRKKK